MSQHCKSCRWFIPLAKQPQAGQCLCQLPQPTPAAMGEMQRVTDKYLEKVPANGGVDCPQWALKTKVEK